MPAIPDSRPGEPGANLARSRSPFNMFCLAFSLLLSVTAQQKFKQVEIVTITHKSRKVLRLHEISWDVSSTHSSGKVEGLHEPPEEENGPLLLICIPPPEKKLEKLRPPP